MISLAVIPLLATLALAQSSYPSAAVPTATGSPLVPDDNSISAGCKAFLDSFNKDPALTACTDSLIQATKQFGPGGSSSSPSKAEVTSAVDNICTGSASSACPDSLIRGKLTDFYGACKDELTSKPSQKVRAIYDVLYVLTPFKKAICSKGDNGDYCVIPDNDDISSSIKGALAEETGLDNPQEALYYNPNSGPISPRAEDVIAANLTTFDRTGIPFLFLRPDTNPAALCTPCTRSILTHYFDFESDVPCAPGISNSVLLGGQSRLVGAIQEKCGENFLNGAVQAAGGIQSGPSFGSNSGAVSGIEGLPTLFAVVAAGLSVAISSVF